MKTREELLTTITIWSSNSILNPLIPKAREFIKLIPDFMFDQYNPHISYNDDPEIGFDWGERGKYKIVVDFFVPYDEEDPNNTFLYMGGPYINGKWATLIHGITKWNNEIPEQLYQLMIDYNEWKIDQIA